MTGRDRGGGSSPRVGFFGILGSGNLGNDGSLDVVVNFLRARHPEVELGFLCMGPERMVERYGAPAASLQWYEAHAGSAVGVRADLLKIVGKLLDPFRTLAWVRRHDLVVVPGMGILESTTPVRPWATPYSLFLLCASARLVGAKAALISVGANVTGQRLTRWLFAGAARLAHYRSYRDALSRDAMRQMGVDVTQDEVYPDLAFALPSPPAAEPIRGSVGVGVMAYRGNNDDRERADELYDAYLDALKRFVRWLVDGGRRVRLFTGDQEDDGVVAEILDGLRACPHEAASRVTAEPVRTLDDLMGQMASVDTVVATRYHNVLCALKLSRATLSIGYATKHDVLMAEMGQGEFCHPARSIDFERMIEQFSALESGRERIEATLRQRNQVQVQRLESQFAALSELLGAAAGKALASSDR